MTSLAPSPDRWSEQSGSAVRARSCQHERAFRVGPPPAQDEVADPELLGPAMSFRVYTPEEMRSAPLRPSNRPSAGRGFGDELRAGIAEAEAAGPRALLKWLGVGMAIGSLLLTAFLLLLNLTDDTRRSVKSTRARATVETNDRAVPSFHLAKAPVTTPVVVDQPTDFEIPDDGPAIPIPATRTAKSRPAAKPAGKPKASARRPPF